MKELIGKKILDYQISFDNQFVMFLTDLGNVIYGTEADCCSYTWFDGIDQVENLINGIVFEVEDSNNMELA